MPKRRKKLQSPAAIEAPRSAPAVAPHRPAGRLERWGPGILICLVVAIAYGPSYDNEFVSWDDDHYIFQNQQVIQPDGIKSGLFDVFEYSDPRFRGTREENRVSHQYYPLVFATYWLEFQIYRRIFDEPLVPDQTVGASGFQKMSPQMAAGFHVTSVALHGVCAVLLIALLRGLGMNTWVAAVAAALFALTPVNVASVAWAAERKNILALLFYLLALLSYLRFRRRGGWPWYAGCLLLYQCALFGKVVSVTFPLMIVVTDRLIDGRWSRLSLWRAAPMLLQAATSVGISMNVEDRDRIIPLEAAQRPLVLAAAFWFYVLKAVLPTGLLPVYPLWHPSWREIRWLLPPLALVASAGLVWRYRRRIPPHMAWAAALFLVTTVPMMGLVNINHFQFAFVADHYFYHGGIGLFVLLALALDALRRRPASPATRHGLTALAVAGGLAFAGLTWARCDDWQDVKSFWFKTLTGDRSLRYEDWAGDDDFWADKHANRNCWPAFYNLANEALRDGASGLREVRQSADDDMQRAAGEAYRAKLREASVLFAETTRAFREADPRGRELWQAYHRLIDVEYRLHRTDSVRRIGAKLIGEPGHGIAGHFWVGLEDKDAGGYDEAERHFLLALTLKPKNYEEIRLHARVLYNLAEIYADVPDKRDLPMALRCLEQALRLNPEHRRAEQKKREIEKSTVGRSP